jgi:hypothetical protein
MTNNNIEVTNKKTYGKGFLEKNPSEDKNEKPSGKASLGGGKYRFWSKDPEELGRGPGYYLFWRGNYLKPKAECEAKLKRAKGCFPSRKVLVIRGFWKEDIRLAKEIALTSHLKLVSFEPVGDGTHYKATYEDWEGCTYER